jgi:2-polyprenyl-3-methyl-5-hydroxy-6-metoxy-1,4-benzoquinol methylase
MNPIRACFVQGSSTGRPRSVGFTYNRFALPHGDEFGFSAAKTDHSRLSTIDDYTPPKESVLVRDAEPNSKILDAIRTRRTELGGATPRFGLFLCDCRDADAVLKTLSRIPTELADSLEEVVVMVGRASGDELARSQDLQAFRESGPFELQFHRPPRDRNSGFGALRKAAFEYALRKGFDQIIIMRGDASHPPERLPELVQLALENPSRFVLAIPSPAPSAIADSSDSRGAIRSGSRAAKSGRLSAFFLNRILGMQLTDYRTSFRLYPCDALARIPFQLASDDPLFDTEIILQLRALGILIHEAPLAGLDTESQHENEVHGSVGKPVREREAMVGAMTALKTAIGYRLHQLHITRDGRYLVDHDIHYTLKHSATGSHAQIISAITRGSAVLDLGCSNGLLARPLLEKDVRVTGVDAGPGEKLASELAEYYQRDLELPLELPYERVFDYVICADVIEHLRNRTQLLRGARRYLKPEGRLIISTPNIALWFYRLSLLVGRFEYGARGVLDETHVHLYTGATFRREIERAGFTILEERVTSLPFEVVFESTGRSRLIRGLESTYHMMARLWPSMFAYQNILEAQITTLDEESTARSRPAK